MENALYTDYRVLEAAAVSVPDQRLGEVVAAIVCAKSAFRGQLSEEELMVVARKKFVPILYYSGSVPHEFHQPPKICPSCDDSYTGGTIWYVILLFLLARVY